MNEGDTDYTSWTKEQLIDKIRKLETHVKQLRNVVAKSHHLQEDLNLGRPSKRLRVEDEDDNNKDDGAGGGSKEGQRKAPRKFDFSSAPMRHVALKILYLGWDYQGLAAQEDTNDTIEAHLFNALTRTTLIEDRSKSNYHRCGRTDKGVSAFSQVISIDVRSKTVNGEETLDYCKMLNRTLPPEIRAIAWSPVRPDFSARFDCNRRTYKYFFPRATLNIENMVLAAKKLIGQHDFRNFCKLDKEKNRPTIRRVVDVDVHTTGSSPYDISHIAITAESFIWHQIRCIVGILMLVGQNLEEPRVVEHLLDVSKIPKKPQYNMAVDYPLVLYDVRYPEEENITWKFSSANFTSLLKDMQRLWMKHAIKSEMTMQMLRDIGKLGETSTTVSIASELPHTLLMGSTPKAYVKLLERPVCANY